MLVLTRKRYETIQIGEDVVVKVIKTGRGCVKLGIEAPANVRVIRSELAIRDQVQGAASASSIPELPHAV